MKIQNRFNIFAMLALLACSFTLPAGAQQSPEEVELIEDLQQFETMAEDLQQLNREMEFLIEELEAFEAEMEASGFAAAFEQYESNLVSCSPVVLPDFPFVGATETIRGWEGDRCRVETRMTLEGETRVSSCLYTQRDIELITGPELYFSEDLERECETRVK